MSENKFSELFVSKVKIEETITEGTGKRYVISGPFTVVDRPNANKRIYPKEVMNKAISAFRKKVENKQVKMSLDHPEWEGKLADTAAILLEVTDVQDDGFAYYKAQIIDTTKGRDLKAILDSGALVGVSTRGYGEALYDQKWPGTEGDFIVLKDGFTLSNIDFVDEPSVKETENGMVLESLNGKCYHLKVISETKESDMSKNLEDLKKEYPEIFADLEKNHVEALDALKKSIDESNSKYESLTKLFDTLVESIKTVIPDKFTSTVIPESEVISAKDLKIAELMETITSLEKKIEELNSYVTTAEAEKVKAERDTEIQRIKSEDPDFFNTEAFVKKFDNCHNAEEVKKCYESIKSIIVAYKPIDSKATASKTVIDNKQEKTLTEAQKKDMDVRNQDRKFSGIPTMTVEEYITKYVK